MKLIIAFTMLLVPLSASAQLLKCIGKDGKIEYAAQCPPGTKEQTTGIRSNPAAPAPSTSKGAPDGKSAGPDSKPKTLAEQEADFKKRRAEQADTQAKEQKAAAEKAQLDRACQDAKNYLAAIESGNRITRTDPKTGERVFLEDAARAREANVARQSIQANCK